MYIKDILYIIQLSCYVENHKSVFSQNIQYIVLGPYYFENPLVILNSVKETLTSITDHALEASPEGSVFNVVLHGPS